jgi:hypothetical protein
MYSFEDIPQRYFGLGCRPENKTKSEMQQVTWHFCFPVYIEVIFVLYCGLLSIQ